MKKLVIFLAIISIFCTLSFMNQDERPLLNHYKFNSSSGSFNAIVIKLDKKLEEISGLAATKEGRLFCHNDEKGEVFQLDFQTGKILKSFSLKKKVKEDFEGIAIVKDMFYMVTSKGDIFEFKEGKNGSNVKYKVYETDLKSKYDVEGLCYDPETNSLLLACKEFPGKGIKNKRAVYSFSLKKKKLIDEPRFLISTKKIEEASDHDAFNPSGIERHSLSGTFFIITGKGRGIIEVSSNGKILAEENLNDKIHRQPEGITFLSDNSLLISDEGDDSKATLTIYPFNP
jgi:uncharacterized protein YjiK